MHIPKGTTDLLELVTFREALKAANTPSPDYDIEKWLYAPNFYSEYRYILGTRGKNPLICIGINPSTAQPDDLDNTLKSVERIALGNGFDSFIMFNVYAQRATRGTIIEKRDYLPDCVRDMVTIGQRYGADWFCAGARSKKGHPHHPLYLRKDEKLQSFDVEEYLSRL